MKAIQYLGRNIWNVIIIQVIELEQKIYSKYQIETFKRKKGQKILVFENATKLFRRKGKVLKPLKSKIFSIKNN